MEVAAGLTTIGVERGDFVALMMDNRVEHVIADQATLHAGGAAGWTSRSAQSRIW